MIGRSYEKATLMGWSKEQLVDYVLMVEQSNRNLHERLDRQYEEYKKRLASYEDSLRR